MFASHIHHTHITPRISCLTSRSHHTHIALALRTHLICITHTSHTCIMPWTALTHITPCKCKAFHLVRCVAHPSTLLELAPLCPLQNRLVWNMLFASVVHGGMNERGSVLRFDLNQERGRNRVPKKIVWSLYSV